MNIDKNPAGNPPKGKQPRVNKPKDNKAEAQEEKPRTVIRVQPKKTPEGSRPPTTASEPDLGEARLQMENVVTMQFRNPFAVCYHVPNVAEEAPIQQEYLQVAGRAKIQVPQAHVLPDGRAKAVIQVQPKKTPAATTEEVPMQVQPKMAPGTAHRQPEGNQKPKVDYVVLAAERWKTVGRQPIEHQPTGAEDEPKEEKPKRISDAEHMTDLLGFLEEDRRQREAQEAEQRKPAKSKKEHNCTPS